MSEFDNNPASGVTPPPTIAEPVAPSIQTPAVMTEKEDTKPSDAVLSKKLLMWTITTTIIFVVAIMAISFAIVVIRGGTLPATDIFSTIINVLGSLLLNIINGGK